MRQRYRVEIRNQQSGDVVTVNIAANHPDDARNLALVWVFHELGWRSARADHPGAPA